MDESELNEMFSGSDATALEILDDSSKQFISSTDEFRVYFETLEQLLSKENEKEALNFKESAQHLSKGQQLDELETSILPYWEDIFDFNLKSSFVMSLFSALEVYLESIRKAVHWAKNTEATKKDARKPFLKKTKKMLDSHFGLSIHSPDWDAMERIYAIRNVLTHTQGRCFKPYDSPHITEKELEIKLVQFNRVTDIVEGTNDISILHGWIKIDPAFCKETAQMVRKFGIDLHIIIRDGLTNRKD